MVLLCHGGRNTPPDVRDRIAGSHTFSITHNFIITSIHVCANEITLVHTRTYNKQIQVSVAMHSLSIHCREEIPPPHDTRYWSTCGPLGGLRSSWKIKAGSILSDCLQCDIHVVTSSCKNIGQWSPPKTYGVRTSTEMFPIACSHALITAKSGSVVGGCVIGGACVIAGN